jgi:hypothetical protein
MRSTVIALVLGAIFVILAFPVYSRRFQIEAKVWHWRHGYTINVGDYVVPVPGGWLIMVEDPDHQYLLMFDTYVKSEKRIPLTANSVNVSYYPRQANLKSWEGLTRQGLSSNGLREVEEFELSTADENLICLGGHELRDVLHLPDATVVSFQCRSSQLELMFLGTRAGLDDFKAIASQIHKRN